MIANLNEVSAEAILIRDDDNGIATLTLNRPEQFNALSSDMLFELQAALDDISADASIRVVIIGANGRGFCAGHDLKEIRSSTDKAFHQALFDRCSKVMLTINSMPQPVIAQIDGIATAAGCQLVANCDLAVATMESRFAVSGINLGLFCSTPAVPLSRNLSRKQAMQMLLTGDFISAEQAQSYGLVNDVVNNNELKQATMDLAHKIAAKSPLATKLGKQMFYQQLPMDLSAAYAFASERMACNMDSEDAREGVDAFMEKRRPEWKGR
ncbi:MAG: enoyl-CoA hydratase [Gammaproteobacteria bacterium]|nr:MAG: enoyl-CoA hydratase [Gammaproteobacteria bacterium]